MSIPHILIVDDDPALLQVLPETLRLRIQEIRVDTADSAAAAFEQITWHDYDVIVTDIKMPGMDGLALLTRIRTLRPDTPTILITGHGEHDLAVQALRGGGFDFIQKPIDRDYLLASLQRAIRLRQLSRQVEAQGQALKAHAAELEQTVAERTRELREANRAKDEFLALLAHELRNPLAPIRNATQVLRLRTSGEPDLRQVTEIIDRQVSRLARLVDDLLDISRIQRGKIELRKEVLDLATVLAQAVESCQPSIQAHQQVLTMSPPNEPIALEADPVRLEQVIVNLLNNAAKYSEAGDRIWLNATREGNEAVIRVRDTGRGIAPEMLSRIFDLFTQADQSLDRAEGGLGIGLTLVRRLVQMHRGSVQVHSAGLGQGSEFTVRLPILGQLLRPKAPAPSNVSSRGSAVKRILIIEDNPDSRETLCDLLRLWGHDVEVAESGTEGVEKALDNPPDVALIDIGLPGMDGYQVARRIRDTLGNNGVFLIALTGYGQFEDRRRALDAGFDTHLVKPVDLNELTRLLSTVGPSVAAENAILKT